MHVFFKVIVLGRITAGSLGTMLIPNKSFCTRGIENHMGDCFAMNDLDKCSSLYTSTYTGISRYSESRHFMISG